ncbi:hypothetical protein C8D04_3659 [Simplicispira sp. 125]|nr:hypothetical protein C8D04_3659 [Simplicispira sp. 125]REG15707.1 hypothetical protein C8D01_0242 [Simplicispira sp. 110]
MRTGGCKHKIRGTGQRSVRYPSCLPKPCLIFPRFPLPDAL